VPGSKEDVQVSKVELESAYHNLDDSFAMSSLPYMSKLESITSSAVRAAEKVRNYLPRSLTSCNLVSKLSRIKKTVPLCRWCLRALLFVDSSASCQSVDFADPHPSFSQYPLYFDSNYGKPLAAGSCQPHTRVHTH